MRNSFTSRTRHLVAAALMAALSVAMASATAQESIAPAPQATATTIAPKADTSSCYSAGVRTGTIQKFSQTGVFTKSWEGQLVQDGIHTNGKSGVTNVWKFSVTDPTVARKIDEITFAGKPIALRYCSSLIHNPLSTGTPYVAVDVVAR